jgi:hypothetical protein
MLIISNFYGDNCMFLSDGHDILLTLHRPRYMATAWRQCFSALRSWHAL